MDKDLITLNEVFNNGRSIYFYQEDLHGTWVTFGYSAYLLSKLCDFNILSNYSKEMHMPLVCISNSDFTRLKKEYMKIIECKDGYYYLSTENSVEENNYRVWASNLKLTNRHE